MECILNSTPFTESRGYAAVERSFRGYFISDAVRIVKTPQGWQLFTRRMPTAEESAAEAAGAHAAIVASLVFDESKIPATDLPVGTKVKVRSISLERGKLR